LGDNRPVLLDQPPRPDALTGLATPRLFLPPAEAMLADPGASPIALVLADIDDCKLFNGCHGHDVGDTLIRAVAEACRSFARPGDLVARVAGETFALLCARLSAAEAAMRAEILRAKAAATFVETRQGPASCTVSIGIAMARAADPQALMAAADTALLAAKAAGKNCVRLAPAA
jgi:diguanylate cyclase (GGDEF)-like protein